MTDIRCIELEGRGVLSITGRDAEDFLQGLISNDISPTATGRVVYAALLTPQGKFLHDFFILKYENAFLLDCEVKRLGELGKRLAAYKLRADIELLDATEDWFVAALLGGNSVEPFGLENSDPGNYTPLKYGGLIYRDPRPRMPGLRAIVPRMTDLLSHFEIPEIISGTAADYERVRISACVPDGSRDMTVGKATLMEFDFEGLRGVDFDKGCYVGQELTARTKYRGLVRRRLTRVLIDGPLPSQGTPVMANGKEAGEMCSGFENQALALLRIDRSEDAHANNIPLKAGNTIVTPLPD